jgi:hypothetical protein
MWMKILGMDWKICEDSTLAVGRNIQGECQYHRQEIVMSGQHCAQSQGETLIHEILEALKPVVATQMEHDELSRWSYALHAVIRDNPLLCEDIARGRPIVSQVSDKNDE